MNIKMADTEHQDKSPLVHTSSSTHDVAVGRLLIFRNVFLVFGNGPAWLFGLVVAVLGGLFGSPSFLGRFLGDALLLGGHGGKKGRTWGWNHGNGNIKRPRRGRASVLCRVSIGISVGCAASYRSQDGIGSRIAHQRADAVHHGDGSGLDSVGVSDQ